MPTPSLLIDAEEWRLQIEEDYAVLCRNCFRKVLDPNKNAGQVFTKGTCPHCLTDYKSSKKK